MHELSVPSLQEYHLLRMIESGSTKKAYAAIEKATGKNVAVKIIDPTQKGIDMMIGWGYSIGDMADREGMMTERRVQTLGKPDLTQHLSALVRQPFFEQSLGRYVLVEELCDGRLDEVDKDIREGRPIDYNRALEYTMQMFKGLWAMHQLGFIYCDMKLPNVLRHGSILKLTDFGSIIPLEKIQGLASHPNFCYPCNTAPELLATNNIPTPTTDIWSLSMVVYELLAGSSMFPIPIQISAEDWKGLPIKGRIGRVDIRIRENILKIGQKGIDGLIGVLQSKRHDNKTELYELMQSGLQIDDSARGSYKKIASIFGL